MFQSRGVLIIKDYLLRRGISFAMEEQWDKEDESKVYFDFTIRPIRNEEKNNKGVYAGNVDFVGMIEFDGKQHFMPVDFYHGASELVKIHSNDLVKNQMCEDMQLPLLRIKYNQEELIEELLDDFIKYPDRYLKQHTRDNWNTYYDELQI